MLFAWNDRLNTNLSLTGSFFGDEARAYLDQLYEDFTRVGRDVETIVRSAQSGGDTTQDASRVASEFEGREVGSLNDRVYQFGLLLMSQLREGQVGDMPRTSPSLGEQPRSAPNGRGDSCFRRPADPNTPVRQAATRRASDSPVRRTGSTPQIAAVVGRTRQMSALRRPSLCAGFLEDGAYKRLRSPSGDYALPLWGMSANVFEDDHCLPSQDDGER